MYVIVLSYGIRGESNHLWKEPDQTWDNVKRIRDSESRKAAEILGIQNIEYWDFEDYPMIFDRERLDRLACRIREIRPDFIISHDKYDAFNPDHNRVSKAVYEGSVMANSAGIQLSELKKTSPMRIYGFEPHQTELSQFVPGIIIDITPVYEKKVHAMQCFAAQHHLIEYYHLILIHQ